MNVGLFSSGVQKKHKILSLDLEDPVSLRRFPNTSTSLNHMHLPES